MPRESWLAKWLGLGEAVTIERVDIAKRLEGFRKLVAFEEALDD